MVQDGPHRLPLGQLTIISVARLAEPIALTSVFPYLPEMIESFGIEKNEVPFWAGVTAAAFSVTQAITGIHWGKASDVLGRKPTLLFGLGVVMFATLLFGFARSLTWAIVARSIAGAASGTVGITRTAVAEMVPWKELQPRAFSFMPIVWSTGSIVGPLMGGALATPAQKFPDIFGNIPFFTTFPFALPNLLSGVIFTFGLSFGALFFKETLESRKHDRDYGLVLGRILLRPFRRSTSEKQLEGSEETPPPSSTAEAAHTEKAVRVRDVFTTQSTLCLASYTVVAFYAIAFDQLLPVFLHMPPEDPAERSFLKFAGGFGMNSGEIGMLLMAYAVLGLVMQFVGFPPVARKYGVLRCFHVTTFLAPIVYILMPFTVLFPIGWPQRAAIMTVMAFKCVLAAWWFPCSVILMTNAVPSPHLLGTLNGVATSVSAVGRALGPLSSGALFSFGAKHGYVVIPWWYLAIFAAGSHVISRYQLDLDGLNPEENQIHPIEEDSNNERQPLLGSTPSSDRPQYSSTPERSR